MITKEWVGESRSGWGRLSLDCGLSVTLTQIMFNNLNQDDFIKNLDLPVRYYLLVSMHRTFPP